MNKTIVAVSIIVALTLIIIAGIGAYVYINNQNIAQLKDIKEQEQKDKRFSECMNRTQSRGLPSGDEAYCRIQADKK